MPPRTTPRTGRRRHQAQHFSRTPAGPQSPELSLGAIMDLCTETELSSNHLTAKVLKLIPEKAQRSEEVLRNVIANLHCAQVHRTVPAETIPWKLICVLLKDMFPSADIEEVICQHVEESSVAISDTDASAATTHDQRGHRCSTRLLSRLKESLPQKHLPQGVKAVTSWTVSSSRSSSPELEEPSSPQRHSRRLHGVSDSSGKQGRNSDTPLKSSASGTWTVTSQEGGGTSEGDDRCSKDSGAEAGSNVRGSRSLSTHITGSSSCQGLEKRQNPIEKHSAQQSKRTSCSTPKVSSPSAATSEKDDTATCMLSPIFRRYPVVELEKLIFVGTSSEDTGSSELTSKKKPTKTASKKEVPFLPSCLSSSPRSNRKTMLAKARECSDTSADNELSSIRKTVHPLSTLQKPRRAASVNSEDVTLTDCMEPVKNPMNTIKNPAPSPDSSHFSEARVSSEGKKGPPRKQEDVRESEKMLATKSPVETAPDAHEWTETSAVVSSDEKSSSPGPSFKEACVSERCELSRKSSQPHHTSQAKERTAPEKLAESQNIPVQAVTARDRDSVRSGNSIPEKRLEMGLHDGPPSSCSASSFDSPSDHSMRKQPSDGPWLKAKSKRMRFTPLQEEALVRGVMKYGTGSWKHIADEGWFDGRASRELSDKYRNLQKYDHLSRVRERVTAKLKQGIDPMKELQDHNRSIYNTRRVGAHSMQPHILPSQRIQAASSATTDAQVPQTKGRGATAGVERDTRATSPVQPCMSVSREHRTDCEPGPELPHAARSERTHKKASKRREKPLPSVSGAHLRDSPLSSDTEASSGDSWTSKSVQPVPKKKRNNCFFSPLEEAALVSGVLKYGTGKWHLILSEGWFSGRNGVQLSDKYRNMVMYGHWERLKKEVEKKVGTPDDPLLQLKELNKAHWRSNR